MLKLREVHHAYGTRTVLRGLSLEVRPGEVYGLLGPNGAGKSSAIRVICGLLTPQHGEVLICGQPRSERSKHLLGVVPQEVCLYDQLTCRENLRFVAALYGLRGAAGASAAARTLERVGLSERAESLARTLSGGMRRRLHVALGLVHAPKLLVLDEATVGMDIVARRSLWELVQTLRLDGLAILMTTHLGEEVEALCSRVGILLDGRLVREGTPEELRRHIPAEQIVTIRAQEPARLQARLTALGIPSHESAAGAQLWFAPRRELVEILTMLEGVPVDSLSQRPVSIEDVYLDVLRAARTAA